MISRLLWILLTCSVLIGVGVGWLLGTESGARALLQRVVPQVVPAVTVERVEGSVWRGLRVQGLAYREGATQVSLDRIRWSWHLPALLERRLVVTSLHLGRLSIAVPGNDTEPPAEPTAIGLPLVVQLPDVQIDELEFRQSQTVVQVNRIAADIHYDRALSLRKLQLQLVEPDLRLRAEGQIDPSDTRVPLQLAFSWEGKLPELGDAAGVGKLAGDLTRLEIEHQLRAPYPLSSRGELRDLQGESPLVRLEGEWQALQWPPTGDAPQATSDSGRYRVSGPLNELALELQGGLRMPDYPPAQAELRGVLFPDRLELTAVHLDSDAGRLHAEGRIGLLEPLSWTLQVRGEALDVSLAGEPWSGHLGLQANTEGQLGPEGPAGRVVVKQIEGTVRDYPFASSGELLFAPGKTQILGFQVRSGEASLTASGQVLPGFDLGVGAAIPDLGSLWPGLSGELHGRGRVGGTLEEPYLSGNFSARDMAFADIHARQLLIDLDWPAATGGRAMVSASGLSLAGQRWETAELQLSGSNTQHRLSAAFKEGAPAFETLLEGSWDGQVWQGVLQKLQLQAPDRRVWSNEAPAGLRFAAEEIRVAPLCLVQDAQKLCLNGQLRGGGIKAQARLQAIQLANLGPLLPPEYLVEGVVDGDASVGGTLDQPQLVVNLVPDDGRVVVQDAGDGEPVAVAYSDASVRLQYRAGEAQANAQLRIAGQADVQLRLSVSPDTRGGPDRLGGSINASLPDLQALAPLVPQAQIRAGRALARAKIGGTLERPQLQGVIELVDSVLEYPDLGLRLEALNLKLVSQGDTRLDLSGGARSGEGELLLDGWMRLEPEAGWPISLRIQGDQLTAVRLPDTQVLVSPDLRLSGNARALRVDGRVVVPEADIEVRDVPSGAVSPSDDVVLVRAGQPDPEPKTAGPVVRGSVVLELGDRVRFKGFGLTTRLQGKLGLELQPGNQRASGNIDLLEGRYKAWGQDLQIEQGRLLFAGPVDNPGVDLRALRVSNDGQVKAYLEVSGNLRKPVTAVRTEPPTSSTDALSYLLSGSAMGQSGGMDKAQLLQAAGGLGLEKVLPALRAVQEDTGLDELGLNTEDGLEGSALVAGKYLTPDLYVRYVQGLFDASAILALRYRLSDNVSVETRSGTTQSVELQYSIEHD